jgi:hypothetical protein
VPVAVLGGVKLAFVSPATSAKVPMALVEDCHWYVRLGVPPLATTVSDAVPPTHSVMLVSISVSIVGSATMVTPTAVDVTVWQSRPVALITTW